MNPFNHLEDGEATESDRKEALRIRELFKRVFREDEDVKECMAILGSLFETHLPSMPSVGFDPLRAAYKDGQKSWEVEIRDIISGKYVPSIEETTDQD